MHPSVILSIWLFAVLLVQVLPIAALAAAGLLALAFCSATARLHFWQLLKRSRWILLTLLLTFLLLTPGERLWTDFSVSKEGLLSGAEHLLRLLSVLLAVAWLVGGRSDEWLLSALWGLLSHFRSEHAKTLIVRLALTLRYSAARSERHAWRSMLSTADLPTDAAATTAVELAHVALSPLERWLSSAFMVAGVMSLWVWS